MLSLCVLYALLSGISGQITRWTRVAVGLVLIESGVSPPGNWDLLY